MIEHAGVNAEFRDIEEMVRAAGGTWKFRMICVRGRLKRLATIAAKLRLVPGSRSWLWSSSSSRSSAGICSVVDFLPRPPSRQVVSANCDQLLRRSSAESRTGECATPVGRW